MIVFFLKKINKKGLLTLPTFVEVFPEIDTISSGLSKEDKNQNSTLQGAAV